MRDDWDYLILWTLIGAGAIATVSAMWWFRYRNSDQPIDRSKLPVEIQARILLAEAAGAPKFEDWCAAQGEAGTFTSLDVVTVLAGLALLAAAVVLTLTGTW